MKYRTVTWDYDGNVIGTSITARRPKPFDLQHPGQAMCVCVAEDLSEIEQQNVVEWHTCRAWFSGRTIELA
jgi:hypothetical protein